MHPRHPISRYVLRTTDVPAAEAFYSAVLGEAFWRSGARAIPLPDRARERGAPSHWAGYVAVEDTDFDTKCAAFTAASAQQLGPTTRDESGARSAWFRDPFGAHIGLQSRLTTSKQDTSTLATSEKGTSTLATSAAAPVIWHLLHTTDPDRALSLYAGLFGWDSRGHVDLGADRGSHRVFAWDAAGEPAGSVTDLARLPHVHAQWLCCFPTSDIESAVAQVHARGGVALGISEMQTGHLIAGCDDPQGAAFALIEVRR